MSQDLAANVTHTISKVPFHSLRCFRSVDNLLYIISKNEDYWSKQSNFFPHRCEIHDLCASMHHSLRLPWSINSIKEGAVVATCTLCTDYVSTDFFH